MNNLYPSKILLPLFVALFGIIFPLHSFPMERIKGLSEDHKLPAAHYSEEQRRNEEINEDTNIDDEGEQEEETCEEIYETPKMPSMNSIAREENSFPNSEVLNALEKGEEVLAKEKEIVVKFKDILLEASSTSPLHQKIQLTANNLADGYQELKTAEHTSKGVSFTLPQITKESSAEIIPASQKFIQDTSLDFTNIRKALKKALRSIPKNEANQQDSEQIAASYKNSYDQAAILLQRTLSEVEANPTLHHNEQTALLLTDMTIKTIQMAAQSVPLEKIRPFRGRVALNQDRAIKIPFQVVRERASILDEEGILVANTAEYALKDLQEAKEVLKFSPAQSPDGAREKFRQLRLNRNYRIGFLLTRKTTIARLKYDDCLSKGDIQEDLMNTSSQLKQEYHLACALTEEHDQLLLKLFNTPATLTSDLNQIKKEIVQDVLNMISSNLKAANDLTQIMTSRTIH